MNGTERYQAEFEKQKAYFQEAKATLLDKFPHEKVDGLDLNGVERFMHSIGLPVNDYIVLDKDEELDVLGEYYQRSSYDHRRRRSGIYLSNLDLAIVIRSEEDEKKNGKIKSEASVVHELSHSAHSFKKTFLHSTNNYFTHRMGFGFSVNGIRPYRYLEESFVTMVEAEYNRRFRSPEQNKKISDAIIEGLTGKYDERTGVVFYTFAGITLPLPLAYYYIDAQQDFAGPRGEVFGAYTLEVLCEIEPSLRKSLVDARFSVEGYTKLIKTLNGLEPKLYSLLQNTRSGGIEEIKAVTSIFNGVIAPRIRNNWTDKV